MRDYPSPQELLAMEEEANNAPMDPDAEEMTADEYTAAAIAEAMESSLPTEGSSLPANTAPSPRALRSLAKDLI